MHDRYAAIEHLNVKENTLKTLDRIFGVLLILGSCGHTVGTFLWIEPMSGLFIWSLGSSLAALLLGAMNLIRAGRPWDKTVAIVTTVGTTAWMLVALAFGISIHNIFDPRPFSHLLISVVLVAFGIRTIAHSLKKIEARA